MSHSKLKIFFCLTACLLFLFAPFLLEIAPDGNSYAFSSRSGNKGIRISDASNPGTFGYNEDPADSTDTVKVPEPATWLLLGAGAAGLAAFKRKLKKK
jgi:hypothetical protein